MSYRILKELGQCTWAKPHGWERDEYLNCQLKEGHEGGHRTAYDNLPHEPSQKSWYQLEPTQDVIILEKLEKKLSQMQNDAFTCWSRDAIDGYQYAVNHLKEYIKSL